MSVPSEKNKPNTGSPAINLVSPTPYNTIFPNQIASIPRTIKAPRLHVVGNIQAGCYRSGGRFASQRCDADRLVTLLAGGSEVLIDYDIVEQVHAAIAIKVCHRIITAVVAV